MEYGYINARCVHVALFCLKQEKQESRRQTAIVHYG